MPKQTTPFQATVHLVNAHTADVGTTVTESRMLVDARPDIDPREVDVVIEGKFNGSPVTTSVEVIEHGRTASITWVEQQINKHRRLPTTLLLLASKSGFSKNAIAAVESEGGWVRAITPKPVEHEGEPITFSMFLDVIERKPNQYRFHVAYNDEIVLLAPIEQAPILNEAEEVIGTAKELVEESIDTIAMVEYFSKVAHSHPQRDELAGYTVTIPVAKLGYFVLVDPEADPLLVVGIEVRGSFGFKQYESVFSAAELDGRKYSSGNGEIFGRQAVWVSTKDESTGMTTVSWRMMDNQPTFTPLGAGRENRKFPALETVPAPPIDDEGKTPSVPSEPGDPAV